MWVEKCLAFGITLIYASRQKMLILYLGVICNVRYTVSPRGGNICHQDLAQQPRERRKDLEKAISLKEKSNPMTMNKGRYRAYDAYTSSVSLRLLLVNTDQPDLPIISIDQLCTKKSKYMPGIFSPRKPRPPKVDPNS